MRCMDVMLAFPSILLALAIVSALTPSLANVMIAVGLSAVPTYARLIRGSVLATKENLYVEAARAIGCRDLFGRGPLHRASRGGAGDRDGDARHGDGHPVGELAARRRAGNRPVERSAGNPHATFVRGTEASS